MERDGLEEAPFTVTADFNVKLQRPPPSDVPVRLVARAIDSEGDRVTVEAELQAGGKVCATCREVRAGRAGATRRSSAGRAVHGPAR
ncbi:MAG: hypothetical protein R3246_16125 [Acidimicrobiia bacterium]|nr:hypothetical protein [Acidimicrobiia bacterium]